MTAYALSIISGINIRHMSVRTPSLTPAAIEGTVQLNMYMIHIYIAMNHDRTRECLDDRQQTAVTMWNPRQRVQSVK